MRSIDCFAIVPPLRATRSTCGNAGQAYSTDKAFSISGQMTGALIIYAFTFMRYSLAVIPKNYLLFACHFLNAGAQLTQGYRWTMYHYVAGADGKAGKIASV